MAMKIQILICLVAFLVQFAGANYKYSSWSDLPRCAQNCLSRLVWEGSTDPTWGCDGKNITCACYGHPRNSDIAPSFFFDTVYHSCITDDQWNPKNRTGGCKNHPTDQDVDIGELKKYENDIFCYLNNATCPHDGCQYPQSSSSSSVASSQTTSSPAASTSSAANTSAAATTSTTSMSAQSVQLTTVGVVVTASIQAEANTSTDPATTTFVQTQSSNAGTIYGNLSDMAKLKSTLALLMLVAVMMILAG